MCTFLYSCFTVCSVKLIFFPLAWLMEHRIAVHPFTLAFLSLFLSFPFFSPPRSIKFRR